MADITVISMGPGGLEYVSPQAMTAICDAQILIGAEKFRQLLPELDILVPEKTVGGSIKLIKENINKKLGVMVTGDAGFYSLAKSVVSEFGKDSVKIIPGVSVVQLAFARLCEPWDNLFVLSLHGREETGTDIVKDKDKFMILCDNKITGKVAVKELLDMTATHNLTVMENLSMNDENIVKITSMGDTEKLTGASLGVIIGVRRGNE